MPSHSSTLEHVLVCILLLVYSCNKAASSLGEGRKIWLQPQLNPMEAKSFLYDTFPQDFLWGTGTSALQIEETLEQEGKGHSIWDNFTHSSLASKAANVAPWEEDVKALEFLGVRSYSFSLSWPWLFPSGYARSGPNTRAVEHYSRLIETLLEKKIEPIVTLYHWDLPQVLQEEYGGWKNETLVEVFQEYAEFCFHTFGDRVRYWLTIHNPYMVAVQGYGTGVHAPGERGGSPGSLTVAHNMIRAHAKAWHSYDTHFRPTQKGQISIVLGSHWVEPQTDQTMVKSCQQSIEAVLGWFANPIFGNGDYPESLRIKYNGIMPMFTPEEKLWVQKTADFFALSFGPNILRLGRNLVQSGQTVVPDLRRLLSWIKLEYGEPRVLLAESGWFSDASVGREDTVAIYLMKNFINQVLRAIRLDGMQVFGYVAWSLVDGFEWNYGYTVRRGLFYVDFTQPNRTRTPKTSAQYYQRLVTDNGFLKDDTFTEIRGRFPCDFHWGIADSTLQVRFYPFSPQFTDPHLYSWNVTGDGLLRPVQGMKLHMRPAQCTEYLAIRDHLRLFASTGVSHYSFALNWSLILPRGDLSDVNTQALRYYRCVLMELKKLNLETVVILYYPTHRAPNLGLPGPLHTSGGWLNRSTVEAFREYAALCYLQLGSWVRYWITINEPNRLVDIYSNGKEKKQVAHNLLLAHAKAWRLYERDHYNQHRALVSIALHADWTEPAIPFQESHKEAAHRFLLFELGRFLDPLLGAKYDGQRSEAMGLPGSPLPTFTASEEEELRGALSFIALNHFTTRLVSPYLKSQANLQQPPEHGCLTLSDPTWLSSSRGQAVVPQGLRKLLNWVSQRYGKAVPIIVTASGIDDHAHIQDKLRQHYLRSYLQEALKAHLLDGINLQGFYMWKLQDGPDPHHPKFGLFTSNRHHSKPKDTVAAYREMITRGGFPVDNSTQVCSFSELHQQCSMCAWAFRNKAMLVFGGCLLITAVMFAALLLFVIFTKRNQIRGGSRRMYRKRRRIELVPSCLCPPTAKY